MGELEVRSAPGVFRRVNVSGMLLFGLVLAALPFIASPFYTQLATQAMIFAMVALSLDLLLGDAGMVSLGQAGFFGAGAYTVGILAKHLSGVPVWGEFLSRNLLVTWGFAVVVGAVLALLAGMMTLRTTGVYFLMFTLAFGQMIHSAAEKWRPLTGGHDGIPGVPRPTLFGLEQMGLDFDRLELFHYLVLFAFLVSFFVLHRFVRSPFGSVLTGLRDNESRVRFLGYHPPVFKLIAFVISGAMAGWAGALHAQLNLFVAPSDAHWTFSAMVLVMVILGGAGSLVGPVVGGFIYLVFQNYVSSWTENWHAYIGLLFVGVLLTHKGGLLGLFRSWLRKGGQAWRSSS